MRNSPGAALMQTYGKLRDYDRDRLCADGTTAERSVRSYARTPGSSLTIASTPRELGPADRYTSASAARCLASGARAVRHDCDHALAVDPGAARVAKQPACRGQRRCRRCRSPTRAVTKPRQLPMPARARMRVSTRASRRTCSSPRAGLRSLTEPRRCYRNRAGHCPRTRRRIDDARYADSATALSVRSCSITTGRPDSQRSGPAMPRSRSRPPPRAHAQPNRHDPSEGVLLTLDKSIIHLMYTYLQIGQISGAARLPLSREHASSALSVRSCSITTGRPNRCSLASTASSYNSPQLLRRPTQREHAETQRSAYTR